MKKLLELTAEQAKGMLGKDEIMDALIKANFSNKELGMNIMERVKNELDAYKELGYKREDYLPIKNKAMSQEKYDSLVALTDAEIVCEALNEGVELKFADSNQRKYRVWVEHDGLAGFGFHVTYGDLTRTNAGSRLYFATDELAEYFGRNFIHLINKISNK